MVSLNSKNMTLCSNADKVSIHNVDWSTLPCDVILCYIIPYLYDDIKRYQYKILYKEGYITDSFYHNYSSRYEAVVDQDDNEISRRVFCTNTNDFCYLLVSRIKKKNNRHRYYLTVKYVYVEAGCDCSHMCYACTPDRYIKFKSKYLGKDFSKAFLYWSSLPYEFNTKTLLENGFTEKIDDL